MPNPLVPPGPVTLPPPPRVYPLAGRDVGAGRHQALPAAGLLCAVCGRSGSAAGRLRGGRPGAAGQSHGSCSSLAVHVCGVWCVPCRRGGIPTLPPCRRAIKKLADMQAKGGELLRGQRCAGEQRIFFVWVVGGWVGGGGGGGRAGLGAWLRPALCQRCMERLATRLASSIHLRFPVAGPAPAERRTLAPSP